MKYIITLIIFFFSLNINASFFPDKKEYENVLKKNFEHEEQKISYFIYYPNPKKNIKKEIYIIFHGETSKAEDFLNKTRLYTNIKNENAAFIAFNSSASDWYSHTRKNIKDKDFIIKLLTVSKMIFSTLSIKYSGDKKGNTLRAYSSLYIRFFKIIPCFKLIYYSFVN